MPWVNESILPYVAAFVGLYSGHQNRVAETGRILGIEKFTLFRAAGLDRRAPKAIPPVRDEPRKIYRY